MSLCDTGRSAYGSGGFNEPNFIFSVTRGCGTEKKGFHLTFSYELFFEKDFQFSINLSLNVTILCI